MQTAALLLGAGRCCRRCSRARRSSARRSRGGLFDAAYAEHARRGDAASLRGSGPDFGLTPRIVRWVAPGRREHRSGQSLRGGYRMKLGTIRAAPRRAVCGTRGRGVDRGHGDRSTASAKPAKKQANYVLGVSNTLVGNGWREEMICAVKAQALASGKVSKVIVANRNGGPAEQIADIRNLISAGANAIIINPSSASALNAVIAQAAARGREGRLGRPADHGATGLQRDERPGRVRPARRHVAVQAARRQGQRGRDARHRRRPGRHRPPQGLPAGAEEVPGHQGRQADVHRLVVRDRAASRCSTSSTRA